MCHIADKADCSRRIKALCRRMKPDILRQAPLNRKTRNAYRVCSISPAFFIFSRQLRRRLKKS
jgi:hypothetical protein